MSDAWKQKAHRAHFGGSYFYIGLILAWLCHSGGNVPLAKINMGEFRFQVLPSTSQGERKIIALMEKPCSASTFKQNQNNTLANRLDARFASRLNRLAIQ